MPVVDGVEATRRIKESQPVVKESGKCKAQRQAKRFAT